MLHITNGDSVGEKLKQGVVEGEVLVWRDLLSEGPIFANAADPEHTGVRAQYLEKVFGIPRDEYIQGSEFQQQRLEQLGEGEDIVLWFEYDLFDQTMLCCLLHWFSAHRPRSGWNLKLLCIDSFPGVEPFHGLGQLTVQQLKTLAGRWQPVGPEALELGQRTWEAYAASDPLSLFQLLEEDTSALPFVDRAFRFHLERFPAVKGGVGIVEKTVLELAASDVAKPYELFRQASDTLIWFGMGDVQFWAVLDSLTKGPHPLLAVEGDAPLPNDSDPSPGFRDSRIRLTDTGRKVLNGEADQVALNGIDRWLGGVRLKGNGPVWRWDAERCKPVYA